MSECKVCHGGGVIWRWGGPFITCPSCDGTGDWGASTSSADEQDSAHAALGEET